MKKSIYKELAVYLILLFVLAGVMHPDLVSIPLNRFKLMGERGNYLHPFVYTLLVYLLITMFRVLLRALVGVLRIYKKKQ